MDAPLEQRPVGVAGLFVNAEKLDDFVDRYHCTVAVRLGLGEPLAQVEQMALDFHRRARESGRVDVDAERFMRWFDRMGIQRHLKAVGIFSRLKIRDGKGGYLEDIPRIFTYLREVCGRDPAMAPLFDLLEALDLEHRIDNLASR